jgi:succinate dehydrogenase/fumarate reductase flavoprotein subunit
MAKAKSGKTPVINVHTLIIGSGAAGLNAAVQLHKKGIKDILILTEGLKCGTSINTGSDKQTYYKTALCGDQKDSPESLAESFFSGGSMHGDIALVEAAVSTMAFMNLASLGVPFPQDKYGQFAGYKTDHDPLQRATSVGPYTSREMCRVLIDEVKRRKIKVNEKRLAVSLLTVDEKNKKQAVGAIALNLTDKSKKAQDAFEIYIAQNVVFAVGGPGGLYKTSVYPKVHTGAIGLALMEGAKARNLPESQFGMASTKFRWNVSGTYMQVIPKIISAEQNGSDEKEFLTEYFKDAGEMNSNIFLKGYQWPFDPRKAKSGSSLIDLLVYIETEIKKRRVFLDFRKNGSDYDLKKLSKEAKEYLEKSGAKQASPIARLMHMNPQAAELYKEHGIDLEKEPLEIAVCAQHNNGGLAAGIWWESENIKNLFPIGEVNGSHGVYRPGGSALNSGQVAGFRVADFISHKSEKALNGKALKEAEKKLKELSSWISGESQKNWKETREEFQSRMSKDGAHIRSIESLKKAAKDAWTQWKELQKNCNANSTLKEAAEAFQNRQLCFAHAVYLDALFASLKSGTGSRGSAIAIDEKGIQIHNKLGKEWKFAEENPGFRENLLETTAKADGKTTNKWVKRRPIPHEESWFETIWAEFKKGNIYK